MMISPSHLKIIAIIISLHGLALVLSQQQDSTVPVCKGVSTFDLYFVLDRYLIIYNNYYSYIKWMNDPNKCYKMFLPTVQEVWES